MSPCLHPQISQITQIYVSKFQFLTLNLHGFDSHGSGVLFKPTLGLFVTSEFGTWTPASILNGEAGSVKSTVFSLLVIPIACVNFPGPNVSRPSRLFDMISIPSIGCIARINTAAGKSTRSVTTLNIQ